MSVKVGEYEGLVAQILSKVAVIFWLVISLSIPHQMHVMVDAPSSVSLYLRLLDGCFHMMPCYPPVMCQGCPVVSHRDVAVSKLVCFVVGYTFSRGFADLSRSSCEQNNER